MVAISKISDSFSQKIENIANRAFDFWDAHKVGILGTISVHLVLAIVFLASRLESSTHLSLSIIEVDMKKDFTESILKKNTSAEDVLPADAIENSKEVEAIRNFAVDATQSDLNPSLTDDKNINAEALYSEAARLKQELDKNKEIYEETKSTEGVDIPNTPEKIIKKQEQGQYKGPAVISYFLKGRKAIYLPVPAYMCQFGGQVVVDIEVSNSGKVVKATIDDKNSIKDECINNAALEAALESSFTGISSVDSRQKGSITYLFVAQ